MSSDPLSVSWQAVRSTMCDPLFLQLEPNVMVMYMTVHCAMAAMLLTVY